MSSETHLTSGQTLSLIDTILGLCKWTQDEIDVQDEYKSKIIDLQREVIIVRLTLENVTCSNYGEENSKKMKTSCYRLRQAVESAQEIYVRFNKKNKNKRKREENAISKNTKTYKAQIVGCKENLRLRSVDFQTILQLATLNAIDTSASSPHNNHSNWDIIYSNLSFKLNRRGEREVLGSGGFGVVLHATYSFEGNITEVAVKQPHQPNIIDSSRKMKIEFEREANQLMKLHHPNIVNFVGGITADEDGPLYIMVTEKLSTPLDELPKEVTFNERKRIVIGISHGLSYLHCCNVLHRDIKPKNIMLSDDNIPKIIDFGLSKQVENHKATQQNTTMAGTLNWMSPEKRQGEKSTYVSDVYSFGLVAAYVFTGKEPDTKRTAIDMFKDDLAKVFTEIDDTFLLTILECLDMNPSKRPPAEEIYYRISKVNAISSTNTNEVLYNINVDEVIRNMQKMK